jgi:hypothetical protein
MKTFLLCLGAHKAGTTWLHHELSRQPYADFGAMKEYHVFDARQGEDHGLSFFRRSVTDQARRQIRKHGRDLNPAQNPGIWMRLAFQANPELYYSYLDGRLNQNPDACLTGDFTPNYSSLSTGTLSEIRSELIRRTFKVRALFLMRDPVDRCWSMERSRPSRQREDTSAQSHRSEWEDALLGSFASESMERRTRYDLTAERISSVFAPEEVRFALYETLFRQNSIDDICQWLDVPTFDAGFSSKINESPKGNQLANQTVKAVATHYAPAYMIARKIFGAKAIREHWPSSCWVPE